MNDTENRRTAPRWLVLDKLGTIGAFLAAAATPCCFPLLAAVGGALGLSALQSARGYVDYAIQAMVLLALLGDVLAYRQHRRRGPLVAGIAASALVFVAYHGYDHVSLVYVGLFGLTVAAVWNVIAKRNCAACCHAKNA
ncbi:MAG: MerC family mercury resistance protein [Verrucomicrobiales bacterium]|nr:MerC family mercury resistance protein [Verrucomicrobiales bacterium]